MRVLVCPHVLELGGSQLNAVELAAAVRDRGHDVSVFGPPGALVARVRELDLPYLEAPVGGRRPARVLVRAVRELVRREQIEVVHGYEWPPILEAFFGATLRDGTATVGTVMSMAVAPFLPPSVPLVVGTEQIGATVRADRGGEVHVLEPPVDTVHNRPGCGGDAFRAELGIPAGTPLVVVVSRLAHELKLEGIERAVAAVEHLDARRAVRLVVVGDGPAREQVAVGAAGVNARLGRDAVVLTGERVDPRPAYDAADVVLGMGGSALRAMAFAKPLVVLGEDGFSEVFGPETLEVFLWQGFYGIGDADPTPARLAAQIEDLLADPERARTLGAFARRTVEARFSLGNEAAALERIYDGARAAVPAAARRWRESARSAAQVSWHQGRRIAARRLGRGSTDDFNAKDRLAAQAGRPAPRP